MVNFSSLITGLGDLGTDLGNFLTNLGPGLLTFVIIMGVGGAIASIIYAVANMIRNYVVKK